MSRIFKYDQVEIGGALLSTDSNGNFLIKNSDGDIVFRSDSSVWTPNRFLDLACWYDASDITSITESSNVVSQINDKSGNGFHLNVITAGKNGPKTGVQTLNGLNVLSWDSVDQILENDSFSFDQNSEPLYLSAIFRCDQDNAQDFIIAGTENTAPGERMGLRRTSPNDSLQILGGSGGGANIALGSGADTAPEGQDILLIIKFNSTNSYISIDGEIKAQGNIGTNSFSSLNIGGNEAESSNMNGYIAELILSRGSPKAAEIEGYLAHKWGLTEKLPSDHPYKTIKP